MRGMFGPEVAISTRPINRPLHRARVVIAAVILAASCQPPVRADSFALSLMPDPRGEFIRLCAPFMVANYAHPEAICDCLRESIQTEIEDHQLVDALLYGVTLRGVPSIDRTWLSADQEAATSSVMSAIARPTIECFFGTQQVKKAMKYTPLDGMPPPPVQDLTP
ncbi:MAG: hypothetical protein JWQ51_2278 [Tardiphaga sp.]|nr:hypothetical protein [Tardiphaga sp.]